VSTERPVLAISLSFPTRRANYLGGAATNCASGNQTVTAPNSGLFEDVLQMDSQIRTCGNGNYPSARCFCIGPARLDALPPRLSESVLYAFTGGLDGAALTRVCCAMPLAISMGPRPLGGPGNAGVVYEVDAAGLETFLSHAVCVGRAGAKKAGGRDFGKGAAGIGGFVNYE
jgi:hypothetical protein